MAREVTYAEQTLNSPNPLTRFAHRSRYKISLELSDQLLPQHGTLCDFGAGEGTFLTRLRRQRPDATLWAIEPYMTISDKHIVRHERMEDLPFASVDVMTAFETLEHVTDQQLEMFIEQSSRVLKPRGYLLITVPIMYGATLPVKEASRMLLHRKLGDIGLADMVRATCGLRISRPANRLNSHRGFDFRWLADRVSSKFRIERTAYSPTAKLPWWLNSQAIYVAVKA